MSPLPTVLCVDAGNTRIKLVIRNGSRVIARDVCARGSAAAVGRRVHAMIARRALDGATVSSVVPSINASVRRAISDAAGVRALFVNASLQFPFRVLVAEPQRLGADRLCAVAGAAVSSRSTRIVVDMGSAVTVDLLDRGRYRGGLIMAGPRLQLSALGDFTEKLPRIDYNAEVPLPRLFRGTRGSMVLGASVSALGGVNEAVATLQKAAGARARVVVTGGAAEPLARSFSAGWDLARDLVVDGLYRIWRLNS